MAQPRELSVVDFREVMTSEINRLESLCSQWGSKAEGDGQVRCAIGKASILISGKIRQFSGLIDDCETGGGKRTRLSDLQGFWEMIGLQIDDVDALFRALNQPKVTVQESTPSKAKKKVKKAVPTVAIKRSASSGIKAHISAKRRELSDGVTSAVTDVTSAVTSLAAPKAAPADAANGGGDDKVFDGGFFKVKSPSAHLVSSPRAHQRPSTMMALTPSGYNVKRGSLTPRSAQANKTTPIAIMAATKALRQSLSPSIRRSGLDFDA